MNKYNQIKSEKSGKTKGLTKKEFFDTFPVEQYHHVKHKKTNESFENLLHLFGIMSIKNAFFRKGPYENTFAERITKFYLKFSGGRFDSILGMIKRRMKLAEII